jgi:hypothetical protein
VPRRVMWQPEAPPLSALVDHDSRGSPSPRSACDGRLAHVRFHTGERDRPIDLPVVGHRVDVVVRRDPLRVTERVRRPGRASRCTCSAATRADDEARYSDTITGGAAAKACAQSSAEMPSEDHDPRRRPAHPVSIPPRPGSSTARTPPCFFVASTCSTVPGAAVEIRSGASRCALDQRARWERIASPPRAIDFVRAHDRLEPRTAESQLREVVGRRDDLAHVATCSRGSRPGGGGCSAGPGCSHRYARRATRISPDIDRSCARADASSAARSGGSTNAETSLSLSRPCSFVVSHHQRPSARGWRADARSSSSRSR